MQKRNFISIAVLMTVLCISILCSSSNALNEVTTSSNSSSPSIPNQTQALLFSDANNLNEERDYYDALLDFRNETEAETVVNIIHADEDSGLIEQYNIRDFPTLIIIKENQSNVFINGDQSMEEILSKLRKHF